MKKIASLILSLVLLLGLAVPALASQMPSTRVTYTAASTQGSYYVDVPNTLDIETANSGTVKAWGTWGATEKLTVTTDPTVQLTCTSDTGAEPVSAVVSLGTTNWSGRATARAESEACSAPISVAFDDTHPAPAAGEWTGTINYNVSCNPATITGLSVKTQPTLQSYLVGDQFNPAGLELTFTYDNNTEVAFSSSDMDDVTYSVTTFTADQETAAASNNQDCDVTVTYTDPYDSSKTYTTTVTVKLWPAEFGSGPYQVHDVDDWYRVETQFENGTIAPNAKFVWNGGDLSLAGRNYSGVGSEKCPFRGTIDFLGAVLMNVTMSSTDTSVAGFFGCVGDGATIKSLTLINFNGSFIKTASGDVTLKNVSIVNGNDLKYLIDTVSSGNVTIQGVSIKDTKISSCYIIGTVNTGATVTFTGDCEVSNCGSPGLQQSGEGTVTGLTLS